MPTSANDNTTRGTTQWIRASRIHVDHRYERSLNKRKVRTIINTFDPDAVGVLYVSKRADGEYVILDGMHRLNAILGMGWGDQKVPCYVYSDLTLADEARMFRQFNELRTRPKPLELHKAGVVEGDPRAVGIEKVLANQGLHLGVGPALNRVLSVESLQGIWDNAGEKILRDVLSVARQAWGSESTSFAGEVLLAIAAILARHGKWEHFDLDRLVKTLHRMEPQAIRQKAVMLKAELGSFGHVRTAGVLAALIVSAYNQRLTEEKRIRWDTERTGKKWWTAERVVAPEVEK